jgi:hypothetical protein
VCFLLSCTARPAAPDAAAPPAASADVQAGPGTTARAGPRAEPASFRPFALLDDADPAALEVPAEGAREPLVLIVEAGSYECPHTRKAEVMIAAVLKEFPDVARCWLHNPLPGQVLGIPPAAHGGRTRP